MIIPAEMFPGRGSGIKAEPIARTMQAINDLAGNRHGDSISLPNGTTASRTPVQPDRDAIITIVDADPAFRGLHIWQESRVLLDRETDEFEIQTAWPRARYHDADGGYGFAYNTAGHWVPPGTRVPATLRTTVNGGRLWVFHATPSSIAVPGLLGASTVATTNIWTYEWAEARMADALLWEAVPEGIEETARNRIEYGNAATGAQGNGVSLPVAGATVELLPIKVGLPLSFEPHGYVDETGDDPIVAFGWWFSATNGITVECTNGGGE